MIKKVNNYGIKIIKYWVFFSLVFFSRKSNEKYRINKI